MKSSPAVDKLKIDYVFGKFFETCKRYRVVTKGAIESVFVHPPRSEKITQRELERINYELLVPLSPDSVTEIMRLGQEYDKLLTNVVFINLKKNSVYVGQHESTRSENPLKCGTYNF